MKHGETLERAVADMACLRTQAALILLRASFGAAKLTFLLKTATCYAHPALGRMDDEIRRGLENILNISLNDIQWIQATLPIRDGGLGLDVSQCWQLPPTWHQPHRPSHSSVPS